MLLKYTDLPDAVFSTLAAHFGCLWSGAEAELMRAGAGRNAKPPGEAFAPDSPRKQQEASAHVREICERLVGKVYRELAARSV